MQNAKPVNWKAHYRDVLFISKANILKTLLDYLDRSVLAKYWSSYCFFRNFMQLAYGSVLKPTKNWKKRT